MQSLEAKDNKTGKMNKDRRTLRQDRGVLINSRITTMLGGLLFVLLAIEGASIVFIHAYLPMHIFFGMLLVPPILLKIGTTMYKAAKYYGGSPGYKRNGPPPIILRMLGPVVIVLTVIVMVTGIALLIAPVSMRETLFFLHRASFVLWFGAMALHVLGHLKETLIVNVQEWTAATLKKIPGSAFRKGLIIFCVIVGLPLAFWMVAKTPAWLHWFYGNPNIKGHG
jgi:hypothetical protein